MNWVQSSSGGTPTWTSRNSLMRPNPQHLHALHYGQRYPRAPRRGSGTDGGRSHVGRPDDGVNRCTASLGSDLEFPVDVAHAPVASLSEAGTGVIGVFQELEEMNLSVANLGPYRKGRMRALFEDFRVVSKPTERGDVISLGQHPLEI